MQKYIYKINKNKHKTDTWWNKKQYVWEKKLMLEDICSAKIKKQSNTIYKENL